MPVQLLCVAYDSRNPIRQYLRHGLHLDRCTSFLQTSFLIHNNLTPLIGKYVGRGRFILIYFSVITIFMKKNILCFNKFLYMLLNLYCFDLQNNIGEDEKWLIMALVIISNSIQIAFLQMENKTRIQLQI